MVATGVFALSVALGFFRLESVVHRQVDDRAEICRVDNTINRRFLDAFHRAYDVVEELGVERAAVERLRQALPVRDEIQRDCDFDGTVDGDDYLVP